MAYKNSVYVWIDGINRTPNVMLPITLGDFLDERLDECTISLRGVQKEYFTPLTPVEIQFNNEMYWGTGDNRVSDNTTTRTRYYVVANDTATEMQIGSGLYNHELYLIEVTKVAECVVVDANTFTNDIGRTYTANAQPVEPVET